MPSVGSDLWHVVVQYIQALVFFDLNHSLFGRVVITRIEHARGRGFEVNPTENI